MKDKRSSYQKITDGITDGISQATKGPHRVYKKMSNIFQGTKPRRVDDDEWMFGEEGKYGRGSVSPLFEES